MKSFKFRFEKDDGKFFERDIEAKNLSKAWRTAHDIESETPEVVEIYHIKQKSS